MTFHVWMLGAMVTARKGQGLVEYMLILTLYKLDSGKHHGCHRCGGPEALPDSTRRVAVAKSSSRAANAHRLEFHRRFPRSELPNALCRLQDDTRRTASGAEYA